MHRDPDGAAQRRRGDIASLGIVVGFAWTLVCLLMAGGSGLPALDIALLWFGGIGAVGGATAFAMRQRAGNGSRRRCH